VTELVQVIIVPAAAALSMLLVGWATELLSAWPTTPTRPGLSAHEYANKVRSDRALRQADRAAYLRARTHREIEPAGYVADSPGTAEPVWLKPDYGQPDTYQQPPTTWRRTYRTMPIERS
jgi:hypothetical protein